MNREELVKEIAKSTKLSQKSVSEYYQQPLNQFKTQLKKVTKLLLQDLAHLNQEEEQQEMEEIHKQVKRLKSQQKQYLYSLPAKSLKNQ